MEGTKRIRLSKTTKGGGLKMEGTKRIFVISVLVVGLFMGFFSFVEEPALAQPKVIRWRGQNGYTEMASMDRFPGFNPGTGGCGRFFVEWIKQRTNGQLVIDLAPPGSIVPVPDMFTATSRGSLDFVGLTTGAFHSGIVPEGDLDAGLPFSWENIEECWDGLYNWGIQDKFREIYAKHNVYSFLFPMGCIYHIGSVGKLDTPKAIKGKKYRAVSAMGRYIEALGGIPVTIPWADSYMGMKLGTIDGFTGNISGLEDMKLKEVLKYYVVEPNLMTISGSFLFNKKSLDALPDDIRKLITEELKYAMLGWAIGQHMHSHKIAHDVEVQGYTKMIRWSPEDIAYARNVGFSLWDKLGAISPQAAKIVDILKAQARDLGKIK